MEFNYYKGLIDEVRDLRPCLIRRRSAGSLQHGAVVENRHLAYLVIGTAIKTLAGKLPFRTCLPRV